MRKYLIGAGVVALFAGSAAFATPSFTNINDDHDKKVFVCHKSNDKDAKYGFEVISVKEGSTLAAGDFLYKGELKYGKPIRDAEKWCKDNVPVVPVPVTNTTTNNSTSTTNVTNVTPKAALPSVGGHGTSRP